MPPSRTPRVKRPVEYSILYTATLCTLAVGAVMVYSASSAESLLQGNGGDPAMYLKRYVFLGLIGLFALHWFSRHGLAAVKRLTPALLGVAFALTIAVMLPGIGVTINGATRWLGAGPLQFQPSELLKVALVLYTARLLAERPGSVKQLGTLCKPLLLVVGAACLLLLKQPDMGTAMVICFSVGCLLVAAGAPMRLLGSLVGGLFVLAAGLAVVEPYRMERVTAFLDPFGDAGDTGFQAVQALTAIGSGGLFGVGLGESVQKIFYLPEAHTDMILAIIGEELGLVGMAGVAVALRHDRLRRPARGQGRRGPVLEAGGHGLHLPDPVPGHPELLRRAGHGPADRRAAAVHLLRLDQPDRAAVRHGAGAERGRHRWPARAQAQAEADRRRPRCPRS